MTLAICPLTPEVVHQVARMATVPSDERSFDNFLAGLGWRYAGGFDDSYQTAAGQVVWSTHYAASGRPDQVVWAAFCVYDPEYDDEQNADYLAEVWGGPDGWTLRREEGRAAFDLAWDSAAEMVGGILGPPAVTAVEREAVGDDREEEFRMAVWRNGDSVLALAQDADPVCYSNFVSDFLVAVRYPADRPLPPAADLTEWYQGLQ
ncbi:hypothetical protein Misp01_47240 [Microtetraspora sp. NBRC 13810]|uniref:hypothetical protein n=1 Tax=Microtetraspora sp. NBRC 13810 TaxID=3030990 RepID=UPI0024A50C0A|nr:hypothetical protein [Microtetraspora sp. NBRC 13810]GLW09595.1 hypothetical protein Misp01_47240 [Microtetraspora sp. NBRC 13810]